MRSKQNPTRYIQNTRQNITHASFSFSSKLIRSPSNVLDSLPPLAWSSTPASCAAGALNNPTSCARSVSSVGNVERCFTPSSWNTRPSAYAPSTCNLGFGPSCPWACEDLGMDRSITRRTDLRWDGSRLGNARMAAGPCTFDIKGKARGWADLIAAPNMACRMTDSLAGGWSRGTSLLGLIFASSLRRVVNLATLKFSWPRIRKNGESWIVLEYSECSADFREV
jgi:hypothetical protein